MDPAELESRFAERDARMAADTRTEAERWLNDPPPSRSALAQRNGQANLSNIIDSLILSLRRGEHTPARLPRGRTA